MDGPVEMRGFIHQAVAEKQGDIEGRLRLADDGPFSMVALHKAQIGQALNGLPDRDHAHPELFRQLPLPRQKVAGLVIFQNFFF